MKLATIRTPDGTRAVRLDGDVLIDLGAADLGELLARPDWQDATPPADAATYDVASADFAPVVPHPSKVLCVGHNYSNHIKEMGRELPAYPTLFSKFADTLIGANDDIIKPVETDALDWEVELVVVVGREVRRATEAEAEAAIAGFTVMNDVSARDWQFRTVEWTQGKIWDSSTPVGPWLVTPDEVGGLRPALKVETIVDGQVMQSDDTGTLLFDPVQLVRYISTIIRLRPGDLIATGTPAGVGHAREPKVYLVGGETVTTEIEGLGACSNRVLKGVSRSLTDGLRWTQVGTDLLHEAVADLSTVDLRRPTALPGWSRAHVVAHVVGNARALGNLVHWAATGEETPMYESAAHRSEEIEAGAVLPAHQLLRAFSESARGLAEAMAGLEPDHWDQQVVTAQGRTVRANEVPWMRAREVCVHAVDLGTGVAFADLPDDFLAALLADVTAKRGEVPAVDGPLPERVAWLTGRAHSLPDAPALGPWL